MPSEHRDGNGEVRERGREGEKRGEGDRGRDKGGVREV
jgi:hypothetical protein